jgi:hypothetical protein
MDSEDDLAGIEYYGIAGGSHDCQDAVTRLLQFGDLILRVRILSNSNYHGLLITEEAGDRVAIKFGFSSGYGGTGPNCSQPYSSCSTRITPRLMNVRSQKALWSASINRR